MAAKKAWKAWHEVVALRDDLKTGELTLAMFAADLDVVMRGRGERRLYEDPREFFALTYPTFPLKELAKDVIVRLAGKSPKAIRQLALTYGGGKTHTLITLYHLVADPGKLPALPAVDEFKAHIEVELPKTRVVALPFDKIDVETGWDAKSPTGEIRRLRHPWSILAWQLAGADGLRAVHGDGRDEERDTSPAEPHWVDLLARPQKEGLSTLILIDEVLMYARDKVAAHPDWLSRLVNFFQHLTQAITKVDRSALIASLLASDPQKMDAEGKRIYGAIDDIFGRQQDASIQPVEKDDVPEVLRRRFFKPTSIKDVDAFKPHVSAVVGTIAAIDEQTKKSRQAVEERFLRSYPFHPDLTEVLYARWTQIDGFQKTRGVLRTFAEGLRDAEKWDQSPIVGAGIFLASPDKASLAPAMTEMARIATSEVVEGRRHNWSQILETELEKAREIQKESVGIRHREIEQAVASVFLSSQPIGQRALTRDLTVLLAPTAPDRIALEKGLRVWADRSWFLDEGELGTAEKQSNGELGLPKAWRLGNRPNLRQMHAEALKTRVPLDIVQTKLIDAIEAQKSLTEGARSAGARMHLLPQLPRDVEDDGEFHYVVLGLKAASESGKASAEAERFLNETTAPDKPRVYRNALVLAVPSRDGIDVARRQIAEHLAWLEVKDQIKGQDLDPIREAMLADSIKTSRSRISEAVAQAYSIVVTVGEKNDIAAFKIAFGGDPLFTTIKNDKRSRIHDVAVNAAALLPGGPWDLWRDDEDSQRVKTLVGAFAQQPRLPKMLRAQAVLDTIVRGVQDGIWVARFTRPDRTVRTYWRESLDEAAIRDPSLEVVLPAKATLASIDARLLEKGVLPTLWTGDELPVVDIIAFFGGNRLIKIAQNGYEEEIAVPSCPEPVIIAAAKEAVERGSLWLLSGPASLLGEDVPSGVLSKSARLRMPPPDIGPGEIVASALPDAWQDGKSTAAGIAAALAAKYGVTLPWMTVRNAITSAIETRFVALRSQSASWPSSFAEANRIEIIPPSIPHRPNTEPAPQPSGAVASATLPLLALQDLADAYPSVQEAAAGYEIELAVQLSFSGSQPPQDVLKRLNDALSKIEPPLKFKR